MDRIEKLMYEYSNIKYVFQSSMPKDLSGFIISNTIFLNSNKSNRRMYSTLAEELGHYETSSHKDITDYKKHAKEELRAREWSYRKIVPVSDFNEFKNGEQIPDYFVSDELDLPMDVVQGAYDMYKRKGVL